MSEIGIERKTGPGYIPELDGLRAIAVLTVIVYHLGYPALNKGGFIGVDIFFVISGFLITRLLLQEYSNFGFIDMKSFYMRRFLRLGPALILMLFVFCLISFVKLDSTTAHTHYKEALVSLLYLSNWARAYDFYAPVTLGHTWSLSIEEQFYILWPLGLILLLRARNNFSFAFRVAVGIAVFAIAWRTILVILGAGPMRVHNGLDTRADALMVGCALALFLANHDNMRNASPGKLSLISYSAGAAALALIFLVIVGNVKARWLMSGGLVVAEVCAAILILQLVAGRSNVFNTLLMWRPLMWIGTISYGLYLWHYPIFHIMRLMGYDRDTTAAFGFGLTILIAAASYYLFEKPIMNKFRAQFSRSKPPLAPLVMAT